MGVGGFAPSGVEGQTPRLGPGVQVPGQGVRVAKPPEAERNLTIGHIQDNFRRILRLFSKFYKIHLL